MVFIENKEADGTYPLSYLYLSSNDDNSYEVYDFLITDGNVDDLKSDYRYTFDSMCGLEEVECVEILKVVSVSNASYVICQKIKNGNIQYSFAQTQLEQEDLLGKIGQLALTIYEDECENLTSMKFVEKVRIR